MNPLQYVSFHGNPIDIPQRTGASVYLSFLPDHYDVMLDDGIHYRFYELEYQVIFELWGNISDVGAQLDLLSQDIGFWQIYQLNGNAAIYMPNNLPVHENRCLPFSTARTKVPLRFQEGKVRTIVIGYKRDGLDLLYEEHPTLEQLTALEKDSNKHDQLYPDISINYRFREILQLIAALSYRPFHIRGELTVQLGTLFEQVILSIEKSTEIGIKSQLAIYHQALRYIRNHFMEKVDKDTIAQALSISTRTLNRAFENRPLKIADYIQRLRLNRARDMLHQGEMSVEEVANELYFPNRKYFSREFKKYFFETPSTIKRMGN